MHIRYANENDLDILLELGKATFYSAFAEHNTVEDMSVYMAEAFTPEIIAADFHNNNILFLIAEIDNDPIGYVKLSWDQRGDYLTGTNPIRLERLYLLDQCIGKGLGGILMTAIIDEARRRGHDTIWLGVWEHNERAIKFYDKWGFKKVGSYVFVLGKDVQNDFVLELELG